MKARSKWSVVDGSLSRGSEWDRSGSVGDTVPG